MSGQFQLDSGGQVQLAAHTQSTGLDNSSSARGYRHYCVLGYSTQHESPSFENLAWPRVELGTDTVTRVERPAQPMERVMPPR